MVILDWYEVTLQSLLSMWQGFLSFIPSIVGALVVFLLGWMVSVAIGAVVSDILKRLKFNDALERGGWKKAMEKADLKVDPAGFIGGIVKWMLVIVFMMASVEILGLSQFAIFLQDVLGYLPNVVVAALIFVAAVIISDILEKVLRTLVEGTQVGYGSLVSVIVRWSIWIFALIAILLQLRVAPFLLQTLLTGIVALIVLAGGIALGLGGKDVAAEFLQDLRRKFRA